MRKNIFTKATMRRAAAFGLAGCMAAASLTGCGSSKTESTTAANAETKVEAEGESKAEAADGSDIHVGIIFTEAGLSGNSFNDLALEGVKKAADDYGITYDEVEPKSVSDEEIIQERHPVNSDATDRKEFAKQWRIGAEQSGLSRRKLIGGALGGAIGIMAVPAIVTLADLGPKPGPGTRRATIERTIWAEGVRLVNDVTYQPIKASDLEIGQLVNAEPENLKELEGVEFQRAKAKAAILIVRMDPDSIKIPESRKDWQVGGILSYSKICTHVGCPVNLWEQQTHHLLCPCHQSTFDLSDSGVVVFGPAGRSLPQLPITVDDKGYLVARSDFTVPVGPSYFERDSRHDYKKGDN